MLLRLIAPMIRSGAQIFRDCRCSHIIETPQQRLFESVSQNSAAVVEFLSNGDLKAAIQRKGQQTDALVGEMVSQ